MESEHLATWQLVKPFASETKSHGFIVEIADSISSLLMCITLIFFNNFAETLAKSNEF